VFKKYIKNQQFNEVKQKENGHGFLNLFFKKENKINRQSRGSQANIYEPIAYQKA
jgi:hypothetical protein